MSSVAAVRRTRPIATGSASSAPDAERAPQRAGDGLHRGGRRVQRDRVGRGDLVAPSRARAPASSIAQERRQLGRRALRGAPHHADDVRTSTGKSRSPTRRPLPTSTTASTQRRSGPRPPRPRPARRRLDHHAHERLGARAAHQHPAPVAELGLDLAHRRLHRRRGVEVDRPRRAARSRAPAGRRVIAAASADSGTPRRATRSATISPVSTPSPVVARSANTMWPDCSPPIARSCAAIAAVTFRSPTGVSTMPTPAPASARRSPRFDITVTDDRVVAQHPALVPVERGHHHDLVAVDELAVLVDRDHAVGVAVERETEVGAVRDAPRAAAARGYVEPQSALMLRPSGAACSTSTSRARGAQRARPELGRGAVRAVEHDVAARRACARRARRAGARRTRRARRRPSTGVGRRLTRRLCRRRFGLERARARARPRSRPRRRRRACGRRRRRASRRCRSTGCGSPTRSRRARPRAARGTRSRAWARRRATSTLAPFGLRARA